MSRSPAKPRPMNPKEANSSFPSARTANPEVQSRNLSGLRADLSLKPANGHVGNDRQPIFRRPFLKRGPLAA